MGSWVCSFKITLIGLGNGPADKGSCHCSYNLSLISRTHLIEGGYLLLWCVVWLLHVSSGFFMYPLTSTWMLSYMTTHTHTPTKKKKNPYWCILPCSLYILLNYFRNMYWYLESCQSSVKRFHLLSDIKISLY